jgi:hypothetical protein
VQSTRGEAETIGRLARANHWRRVTVVTSSFHVTRARILLERCHAGPLTVVGVRPGGKLSVSSWTSVLIHEWVGIIAAEFHRGC